MSDFLGTWTVVQKTPMGTINMTLAISDDDGVVSVVSTSDRVKGDIVDAKIEGDTLTALQKLTKPMPGEITLTLTLTSPTTFQGSARSPRFPPLTLNGTKNP